MADVNWIIEQAAFTEDERDTATSGECGTLALLIHRVLRSQNIASTLVLICEANADGSARIFEEDYLAWRHAAVQVGDQFFDVDGLVELEHLKENYVWGNGRTAIHVELSERDFLHQIMQTHCDLSDMYYREWKPRLEAAFSSQPPVLI